MQSPVIRKVIRCVRNGRLILVVILIYLFLFLLTLNSVDVLEFIEYLHFRSLNVLLALSLLREIHQHIHSINRLFVIDLVGS